MADESVILVPIPGAEPLVGSLRAAHDKVASAGIPAHITILFPFRAPGLISESDHENLARLAEARLGFPFRLNAIGRWPKVVYLAPEDPGPFLELIGDAMRQYPECPPYGGKVTSPVPHLTVAQESDPVILDQVVAALEKNWPEEPISGWVRDIQLWVSRQGHWTQEATFALKSS